MNKINGVSTFENLFRKKQNRIDLVHWIIFIAISSFTVGVNYKFIVPVLISALILTYLKLREC